MSYIITATENDAFRARIDGWQRRFCIKCQHIELVYDDGDTVSVEDAYTPEDEPFVINIYGTTSPLEYIKKDLAYLFPDELLATVNAIWDRDADAIFVRGYAINRKPVRVWAAEFLRKTLKKAYESYRTHARKSLSRKALRRMTQLPAKNTFLCESFDR